MDRNRDGLVTLTEFLGPPELFRRLDLNGDGFIGVDEAEHAEKDREEKGDRDLLPERPKGCLAQKVSVPNGM